MGANPSIHLPCFTIEEQVVCESWSHLQSKKRKILGFVQDLVSKVSAIYYVLSLKIWVFSNDNTCCLWCLYGVDELYCDSSFQIQFCQSTYRLGSHFQGRKMVSGLKFEQRVSTETGNRRTVTTSGTCNGTRCYQEDFKIPRSCLIINVNE